MKLSQKWIGKMKTYKKWLLATPMRSLFARAAGTPQGGSFEDHIVWHRVVGSLGPWSRQVQRRSS
jgi:hypothetical protein